MTQNLTAFIELLREYARFQSISTDSAFQIDIAQQVDWLKKLFEDNKFTVQILQGPRTNPVVLASYHLSDNAETVMVYGHYDVQPAATEDGWTKPPFELDERNGHLYARGVVDNKGQNLIHIFTVINLIKEGKLKYNVKFMIEGNEETGNPDMTALVTEHAEALYADHIIISDGQILGTTPTLETSMRGAANLLVTFNTAKDDQHSGLYGGVVPNALHELVLFLARLKNGVGRVLIPGFYDGMNDIPTNVVQANVEMALEKKKENLATTGAHAIIGENDFYTQLGLYPTIEYTGITSGYTGEGFKNIIPVNASARINIRIVASQNIEDAIKGLKDFAAKIIPSYVKYEITGIALCEPVKLSTDSTMAQTIMTLQREIYGKEPMLTACGASIPIVSDFQNILCKDAVLASLANDDCRMHAVNENFSLDLIEKGMVLSHRIFSVEE